MTEKLVELQGHQSTSPRAKRVYKSFLTTLGKTLNAPSPIVSGTLFADMFQPSYSLPFKVLPSVGMCQKTFVYLLSTLFMPRNITNVISHDRHYWTLSPASFAIAARSPKSIP